MVDLNITNISIISGNLSIDGRNNGNDISIIYPIEISLHADVCKFDTVIECFNDRSIHSPFSICKCYHVKEIEKKTISYFIYKINSFMFNVTSKNLKKKSISFELCDAIINMYIANLNVFKAFKNTKDMKAYYCINACDDDDMTKVHKDEYNAKEYAKKTKEILHIMSINATTVAKRFPWNIDE